MKDLSSCNLFVVSRVVLTLSLNSNLTCLPVSIQAPVPCQDKVASLEVEIQGLVNVINDQHRYIQELHNSQAQQLEHMPNLHLGPENLYRGRVRFLREIHTFGSVHH